MHVTDCNAKSIELVATIIRADGTVEELGVVDYWHKNPIKRLIWSLKQLFRRK